jgi:RecG-like helicase
MKTISIYEFSELSENVKQKVLENFDTELIHTDHIYYDSQKTLEKFKENIAYKLKYMENDDITGLRLHKWILNNLYIELFKPKFIGSIDKIIKHKRLENNYYKSGNVSSHYYSGINVDNSCVLTGVCYDDDILTPIYEFLKNPYDLTFRELINDCMENLEKSLQSELDYLTSEEGIIEHIACNDYMFTENGDIVNL